MKLATTVVPSRGAGLRAGIFDGTRAAMTHEALVDRPRQVANGGFDVAPSCLGFGCASLGSRVGARAGLRALAAAYDAGITWYDVAPAYGAGEAETLLAPFLQGRRDNLVLTTKVGIAPPARLGAMKLAYALGRPAIGALGGLRRAFRKASATRNRHLPIDGALVERSIEASLKRLRTDRVDVYALHDPEPEDVVRDDVLRALERVLARGQARRIAVAGRRDACRAAMRAGTPYSLLQMSTESFAQRRGEFGEAPQRVVLHSVFGVDGMRDRLLTLLRAAPAKRRRLVSCGYDPDPTRAASDLLLDSAFALNPNGIVLTSMFGPGHLASNLARAGRASSAAPDLLREMLG